MRLNGKRAIMEYLGRDYRNWRAWELMKRRYGHVIRTLDRKQHLPRYWTLAEWLNAVDISTGDAVIECGKSRTASHALTYAERVTTKWKQKDCVAA